MFSQNDNELVYVPIVNAVDNSPVSASTFSNATFLITTFNEQSLFEGRLNEEITISNDQFEVQVPGIDYVGPVILEMRVWYPTGESKTIISTTTSIQQTYIERENNHAI
jgi:hypothetical protein